MKCSWHLCSNDVPQLPTTPATAKYCSQKCKNKSGVDRFRRNIKLRAVHYLGGACIDCGYSKCVAALCFHHVEPNRKDFTISKDGNTAPWSDIVIELDKCVLLCLNCHAEAHAREDNAVRLAGKQTEG